MTTTDDLLPRFSGAASDEPRLVRRAHLISRSASWFVRHFPGDVFYALKANPDAWAMDAVRQGGVASFEAAGRHEVALVRAGGHGDQLAFAHPIKSPAAIASAYFDFGCRTFALDHPGELDKIQHVLGPVKDLTLLVRMGVSNDGAALPLVGKFGASVGETADLLRASAAIGERVGVSFHVGSQNHRPQAFVEAMAQAGAAAQAGGAPLDILDVGGGFPEHYPGMTPPPWSAYIAALSEGRNRLTRQARDARLWCEPGRALVAAGASLRTGVLLRKDRSLYINDGGFGALFDAVWAKWRFPARVWRDGAVLDGDELDAFTVFGATCDSDDVLAHTVSLPANVAMGDEIEFGQVGAYGAVMANRFNGFGVYTVSQAGDDPFPNALNTGADAVRPAGEQPLTPASALV